MSRQGIGRVSAEVMRHRQDQVRYLTLQNYNATEIAAALGITPRTVQRYRAATGVAKPAPAPIPSDVLEQARQLFADGCSYTEVSRTLGVARVTLAHHFPGCGWTKTQAAEWSALFNRAHEARCA